MKKLMLVCVLALAAASLGACNTVRGVGQDIEQAGEAIQKSSK
jgi:predicted small secreted protein